MFDKEWHDGTIFKIKQNDISDIILNLLFNFLRNRNKKVSLKGKLLLYLIFWERETKEQA